MAATPATSLPPAAHGAEVQPRVLLVEDDDGDALLIAELLVDAHERFELVRAHCLGDALLALGDDIACVLLDLGLPDTDGLDGLQAVLRRSPQLAIVVLTGLVDTAAGRRAVAFGAQDFLVKGEVDGATLARSIRYAIERRRAEVTTSQLLLAEQRQAENARLARGLLPRLLVDDQRLVTATRYQPGGRDAVLGGDFYDAVQLPDGSVHAVIGDVCGHGPDEAAVGVALRIAWRALVLAGVPGEAVLAHLGDLLATEGPEVGFATVCDVEVTAPGTALRVRPGHPPPLMLHPMVRFLDELVPSPPLGLGLSPPPSVEVPLGEQWALLLVTDGTFECRVSGGRMGTARFRQLAAALPWPAPDAGAALDALLDSVRVECFDEFADDVAVLYLGRVRS